MRRIERQKNYNRYIFRAYFKPDKGTVLSIEDYASEITKLSARAYGDIDRDQNDGLIREKFAQRLRPKIKGFVVLSNPKTFEEAFRNAKREEANNRLVHTNVENPKAACALNVSVEDCIKKLTGQVQVLAMRAASGDKIQIKVKLSVPFQIGKEIKCVYSVYVASNFP